jgi:hypothetical protein
MNKLSRLASAVAFCAAFTIVGVGIASASSTAASATLICNGTYNNMTLGDVSVPAGDVCRLDSDTVNGNITVLGQIYASSLNVNGFVRSIGGQVVQIDSSSISGAFTVKALKNGPSNQDSVSIVINDIGGNLIVQGNTSPTGDELVSSNTVHGSEAEASNMVSGDLAITAETVSGNMIVYKNSGAGLKEVDGNSVTGTLLCFLNQSPFEAHGNSAGRILGPC